MSIDLDTLSYEELITLNHKIVERLKYLDSVHAFEEMASLNIGAQVSFESKVGRQTGTVMKFNTKTVGILAENGRRWNVPPHLLSRVKDVNTNQHVININSNRKRKKKRKK